MRIILYLLEYIHGSNPRSIRDIMVKSKSRSINTMAKKGRNILEKVKKSLKKVISVGIVAAATVVLGQNSGVWLLYIG
jgi:predicted transcriptional regulator